MLRVSAVCREYIMSLAHLKSGAKTGENNSDACMCAALHDDNAAT